MRERRTGPRASDFISDHWLRSVESSAPNTYRGSAGTEVPVQKRRSLLRALETDLCPRAGRLKGCGLGWRVCHGQLYAGSGEGQSCKRGSGYGCVEQEEASNQCERVPK